MYDSSGGTKGSFPIKVNSGITSDTQRERKALTSHGEFKRKALRWNQSITGRAIQATTSKRLINSRSQSAWSPGSLTDKIISPPERISPNRINGSLLNRIHEKAGGMGAARIKTRVHWAICSVEPDLVYQSPPPQWSRDLYFVSSH